MSTESEETLEPPKRAQGWISRALAMLFQQFFPLLVIILLNGVVLRMSLRDSSDLLAPLFYATPWPVLAVLTLVFIRYIWRQPMAVFAVIFIAHIFGAAWIMENWRPPQQSKEPADLRVLHWNVFRPSARSQTKMMAAIRDHNADVIAISEPVPVSRDGSKTSRTESSEKQWKDAFQDYSCELHSTDLLCLIRGKVVDRRMGILFSGSTYALYDAEIADRPLRILQVDIAAQPARSRRQPLAALTELVNTLNDKPLILLGDFNTPRDSVHLEPLGKSLRHAWLAAGRGCAETWPSFLPVLSLDQIWSGYGLRPVRCQHGVTFRSDHRPVFAELRFE